MSTPKQSDRISPLQTRQSNLYLQQSPSLEEALLAFCQPALADLPSVAEKTDIFPVEVMASPPLQARLLQMLVTVGGVTSVLEIGTYIGLTTLAFAQVVGEEGHVTTIEKGDEFGGIAKKNFNSSTFGKRITLYVGDALEIIPTFPDGKTFDLVFLDGAKEMYWDIFCRAEAYMKPGAILITDDVFCQGDALQREPKTDKGKGTKRFVENMFAEEGWTSTIIPIFNGLFIAKKK